MSLAMTPYPTRHWLTALAAASLLASAHAQPATPNNLNEPISRLLPLRDSDVPPNDDRFCRVEVFSESGEPIVAVTEVSDVYARFIEVPATDNTDLVPEKVNRMTISDRKATGQGGYLIEIKGRPDNMDRWRGRAYLLTLKVSGKQACLNDTRPDCFRYDGTLDQTYQFDRQNPPIGDLPVAPVFAPRQHITLREHCPKSRYRNYGLFEVPGILDFIGGMVMSGHGR